MIWCERETKSGVVFEREFYTVSQATNIKKSKPKVERFENQAERDEYNRKKALKRMIRNVNATFNHNAYYVTLTYSDEFLPDDFQSAEKDLNNYIRRIQRIYPFAKIVAVKGRGKESGRIHFHLIIGDVPKHIILEKWVKGKIKRIEHLRRHNFYNDENGKSVDHGEDFTALATYLFNHWTEEQGKGKRWKQTKTIIMPESGTPKAVVKIYDVDKPPKAPKGYMLVSAKKNPFCQSCICFKYVLIPPNIENED